MLGQEAGTGITGGLGPARRLADGLEVQRRLLDDFDLAFGRQAQRGEMFAHDLLPMRHRSFVAQGNQWINLRRAPRRDPAGEQRNQREQDSDSNECQGVGCANAKEKSLQDARERHGKE